MVFGANIRVICARAGVFGPLHAQPCVDQPVRLPVRVNHVRFACSRRVRPPTPGVSLRRSERRSGPEPDLTAVRYHDKPGTRSAWKAKAAEVYLAHVQFRWKLNVGEIPHPVAFSDGKPLSTFPENALDHNPIKLNRDHGLAFCLSMIFFRKPVPTFRDHALARLQTTSALPPNAQAVNVSWSPVIEKMRF